MVNREVAQHKLKLVMSRALEVMKQKNRDYSGAADLEQDSLQNFRKASEIGINPLTGVLVRMQDKLMRVEAFLKKGSLAVAGESCIDSIVDNMNYCILGYAVSLEQPIVTSYMLFNIHEECTQRALNAQEMISEEGTVDLWLTLENLRNIIKSASGMIGCMQEELVFFPTTYLAYSALLLCGIDELNAQTKAEKGKKELENIKAVLKAANVNPVFILETSRAGDCVDNGYGVDFDLQRYAVIYTSEKEEYVKGMDMDNLPSMRIIKASLDADVDFMKFNVDGCTSGIVQELKDTDGYEVIWKDENFIWPQKD